LKINRAQAKKNCIFVAGNPLVYVPKDEKEDDESQKEKKKEPKRIKEAIRSTLISFKKNIYFII